jgi:hypothetical protein
MSKTLIYTNQDVYIKTEGFKMSKIYDIPNYLFSNTLSNLIECKEALEDGDINSEEEMYASIKLLHVCREISNLVSESDIRNFLEANEEE